MVSEVLIHKVPEDASFEDFEEVSRCYAEIYDVEIFLRGDERVMIRVEGEEVFVTDELLRSIRGSDPNPFYIDANCRVRVRSEDE